VNREEFLRQYREQKADRDRVEASIANVLRAMRVQQEHVKTMHELVVPAVAWIGTVAAMIWVWAVLDAHRLVWIFAAHFLFRFFARGYMNIVWIPSMFRSLGKRFPEFQPMIREAMKDEGYD